MRLLIVAVEDPRSAHGGAAARTRGWIAAACRTADVDVHVLGRPSIGRRTAALGSALVGHLPYHLRFVSGRGQIARLAEIVERVRPEVVQYEQLAAAQLAPALLRRSGHARRAVQVFSAHNLEHRIVRHIEGRIARRRGGLGAWLDERHRARVEALEQRLVGVFDGVVAVREDEADWLCEAARRRGTEPRIEVFPNAVDLSEVPPPSRTGARPASSLRVLRSSTLLYVGHLGYPPNIEAAERLVDDVLPEVRARVPGARVLIVGRRPGRRVRRLRGEGVEVRADSPTCDFWREASVLVCPLRSGAGTRIKLLEAAAHRVPIVSTGFGASGLALRPGVDYLEAETDDELARATVRLLEDSALGYRLARCARARVETHHDWSRLAGPIGSFYAGLVGDDREGRGGHRRRDHRVDPAPDAASR